MYARLFVSKQDSAISEIAFLYFGSSKIDFSFFLGFLGVKKEYALAKRTTP